MVIQKRINRTCLKLPADSSDITEPKKIPAVTSKSKLDIEVIQTEGRVKKRTI